MGSRPRTDVRAPHGPPRYYVGLDVGGTKVYALVTDARGRVLWRSEPIRHGNAGHGDVISHVVRLAKEAIQHAPGRVSAVGIGVAAQVDAATGSVVHAPNLGWRNIPLGRRVRDRLQRPVSVLNDARAATYGEWRVGGGRGETNLLGLAMGTGLGGSAVLDGRLITGAYGAFGEVGHMTLVSGGRPCTCGHRGCLEAYVGGWAVAQRAREALRATPRGGRAGSRLRSAPHPLTARDVFAAYRARDPLARRIVRETLDHLGNGAVGIANALDPGVIVLVGGWVAGLPEAATTMQRAIARFAQPTAARTRVRLGALGEDAVAVGAALYARDARSR